MSATTLPRLPRRDSAENREALLSAARVVFNRDPNATLDAVAAEAGLSRRSVYGHFASRDELLLELVTTRAQLVSAALDTVEHPDALIRLALIASRLWIEIESVRVMAVVALRGPLAPHTVAALDSIRRTVRTAIGEAQGNGSIRTDIPADRLTRLVEDTALLVLEESTEHPLGAHDGHELIMLMTLSAVGLGWREAHTLISDTPELHWTDDK